MIRGVSYRVPDQKCPHCGQRINGAGVHPASDANSRAPEAGDMTICVFCTAPLVFGEGLAVRLLTPEEFAAMTPAEQAELVACKEEIESWQARLN